MTRVRLRVVREIGWDEDSRIRITRMRSGMY